MTPAEAFATGAWEPWQPQVGQVVRVLPRPECWYCREFEGEDGAIGVVEAIQDPGSDEPGASAHVYWVRFCDPVPLERVAWPTGRGEFAACELTLLDAG